MGVLRMERLWLYHGLLPNYFGLVGIISNVRNAVAMLGSIAFWYAIFWLSKPGNTHIGFQDCKNRSALICFWVLYGFVFFTLSAIFWKCSFQFCSSLQSITSWFFHEGIDKLVVSNFCQNGMVCVWSAWTSNTRSWLQNHSVPRMISLGGSALSACTVAITCIEAGNTSWDHNFWD